MSDRELLANLEQRLNVERELRELYAARVWTPWNAHQYSKWARIVENTIDEVAQVRGRVIRASLAR